MGGSQFLQSLARLFAEHYGEKVSERVFVFPTRRAGLFFRHYLSDEFSVPVFAPEMLTMNELFSRLALSMPVPLRRADNIGLLFKTYEAYRSINSRAESFEQFVFWERIILSDFNEIDTHRVDAKKLLSNVVDLKQIDQLFDDGQTLRARHLAFWRLLYPLYEKLTAQLKSEGLAYEGMLQRAVVDYLEQSPDIIDSWQEVVFVGFNALTPVESALMQCFQKAGKADFYWDYASEFLSDTDNNASLFAADNLRRFPSRLPFEVPSVPIREIQFEHVETMSDVDQTLAVSSLLSRLFPDRQTVSESDLTRTAVVLPDERMLVAQMHALPEQIDSVNVTMGYPLSQSQLAGLIDEVFALHCHVKANAGSCWFYYKNVVNLLVHPTMQLLLTPDYRTVLSDIYRLNMTFVPRESLLSDDALLQDLFTPMTDAAQMLQLLGDLLRRLIAVGDTLTQEYAYRYLTVINRFTDLWQAHAHVTAELTVPTLQLLLRQVAALLTVAFEGEPLSGLQVMGVLETRTLDFDNLIITSVNDEVFPQKNRRQSLLSEQLRVSYGLPTQERAEAITAYNFYRMLSRAKHVWLVSNLSSGNNKSGEVSRYLLQLYYHYQLAIPSRKYPTSVLKDSNGNVSIEKTAEVMRRLREYLSPEGGRGLSPSALTCYLECPMKFALLYVLEYRQSPAISQMAGSDLFGTVFHAVMEQLYRPYEHREVTAAELTSLIDNKDLLRKTIREVYIKEMFHDAQHSDLDGVDVLTLSVLLEYTIRMLNFDRRQAPFTYLGAETKKSRVIALDNENRLLIEGKIDRIDLRDGRMRVIDYKTGSGTTEFDSLPSLFSIGCKNPYAVQTLFYCLLLDADGKHDNLEPHIYFLREASRNGELQTAVHPKGGTLHYAAIRGQLTDLLRGVAEEMLNPEQPFVQSPSRDCRYCHLLDLCPNARSSLPKA